MRIDNHITEKDEIFKFHKDTSKTMYQATYSATKLTAIRFEPIYPYLSDSSRICISFSLVNDSASKPLTPTMTSPAQRTSDLCAHEPGINCVIRGGPHDSSFMRPLPTTTPR